MSIERRHLTLHQRRTVTSLERAINACSRAGLAVVADFECGFRIMVVEELKADDLRKRGFTIDAHGNCGCPVLPKYTSSGG